MRAEWPPRAVVWPHNGSVACELLSLTARGVTTRSDASPSNVGTVPMRVTSASRPVRSPLPANSKALSSAGFRPTSSAPSVITASGWWGSAWAAAGSPTQGAASPAPAGDWPSALAENAGDAVVWASGPLIPQVRQAPRGSATPPRSVTSTEAGTSAGLAASAPSSDGLAAATVLPGTRGASSGEAARGAPTAPSAVRWPMTGQLNMLVIRIGWGAGSAACRMLSLASVDVAPWWCGCAPAADWPPPRVAPSAMAGEAT